MANNNDITLNKELLAAFNVDPGLPVSIQTIKALKNLSFTGEYDDISNSPTRLSQFENDLGIGIGSGSKYAIYKEVVTRYDYTTTNDGIAIYSIPNNKYNADIDSLEIYVDNVKLIEGDNYAITDNNVTIGYTLPANTTIVHLIKSLRPVVAIDADSDYEAFASGYVPNTTTIAGIPLTDNITVEQLNAVGIGGNTEKNPSSIIDDGGIILMIYTDKAQPDYVFASGNTYITYKFNDDATVVEYSKVVENGDTITTTEGTVPANHIISGSTSYDISLNDCELPYLFKLSSIRSIKVGSNNSISFTRAWENIYLPVYIDIVNNVAFAGELAPTEITTGTGTSISIKLGV